MRKIVFYLIFFCVDVLMAQEPGTILSLDAVKTPIYVTNSEYISTPTNLRDENSGDYLAKPTKEIKNYLLDIYIITNGYQPDLKVVIKAGPEPGSSALIGEVYNLNSTTVEGRTEIYLTNEKKPSDILTMVSGTGVSAVYQIETKDKERLKYISVTVFDKQHREISSKITSIF